MAPPKLVDYSMFKKKVNETPKIIVKEIKSKTKLNNNDFTFLVNIIIFLILFIGGYLLYKRYKNKEDNKKIYTQKIENLYNTINKYG